MLCLDFHNKLSPKEEWRSPAQTTALLVWATSTSTTHDIALARHCILFRTITPEHIPTVSLEMIGEGRTDGWLKRSVETLPAWAEFHGVKFNGIRVGPMPGFEHYGSTVIATRRLVAGQEDPLIVVPKELILSRQNIEVCAKSDQHLKEVLDALGEFGHV